MEILKFLKWNWDQFEFWQKSFVFSMFLLGCGITAAEPWDFWFRFASMMIILAFLFKWAVWDGIRSSWAKYREHRNNLFSTIKTSDKE